MENLPPLPKIEGDIDLILDVHTHKSLRFAGASTNQEYGDIERVTILGESAFDLAVTLSLFSQRPQLSATEIQEKKKEYSSDANISLWLNHYHLKERLRFAPDAADSINSPEESRHFFFTYVGALYIRNQLPTVLTWIGQLINPSVNTPVKQEPAPTAYGNGPQTWGTPAPPSSSPPPLPNSYSPPTGGGNVVTLQMVNQTAAQKGFAVTYPAERTGPSHSPLWAVKCCLNGIEKGSGTGQSQKAAKEAAARQAWTQMGWFNI